MRPSFRTLRARARGEEGASLVFVMLFVVCVGLVLTAVLGYANAGITSAAATQSRQDLSADASGALDVAINTLRHSPYADDTAPCPVDGLSVPGAEGEVRITCQPETGTGVSAGIVPITALNRPGSAVLTLGTSTSETGFAKGSNGILRIKGRVYVNSNITVAGTACPSTNCSEINVVEAPVIAKTGCPTDKVFSTVSVDCAFTGNPPEGKDPNLLTDADVANGTAIGNGYDQPPSGMAQLVPRFVDGSSCPGQTATLEPGYYTDAVALSELVKKCQKWVHFKPGVYYFDFRNEEVAAWKAAWEAAHGPTTATLPMEPGANEFRIHNTKTGFHLVGGEKKDWSGDAPLDFPGSCVSPLTETLPDKGVQFVFGGNSRMNVTHGSVELCGQYATDKPALVVYGAKSGSTVVEPLRVSTASTVTSPVDPTHLAFTTPAEGQMPGGGLATASIVRSPTAGTTASMRLSGTDVSIPVGSLLTRAELRVTHQEAPTTLADDVTVAVRPNAATTPAAEFAVPLSGSMTTDTLDVTDLLMEEVYRNGLSDLKLDYVVEAGPADLVATDMTADLDGAQLWLEWQPPSLRGENEPIAGAPSCVVTGTACPVVKAGSNNVSIYFQGTTYVPLGHVNISLTNVSGQVFKSGIIARSLDVSITPSTGFSGAVIEVPEDTGAGVNMDVYLAAYSCRISSCASSAPPPSADWRRVGRATVSLESTYPVPADGSRAVTVKSWNLLD